MAFDDWVVGHLVGQGGMGRVWRATHRVHRTPVALKVITHRRASDAVARRMFFNEARAVAGLAHPNIVSVYDYDHVPERHSSPLPANSPFLVMELVEGTLLDVEPLSWEITRGVIRSVLRGLAHAHARGVLHLDIKPSNILVADGAAKLCDWGIAMSMRDPERGESMGTLPYMAPENLQNRRALGPWSDLFSLGVTVEHLWRGPTGSAGLDDWLRRMTAPAYQDRYASASTALHGFEAVCAEVPNPPRLVASAFDMDTLLTGSRQSEAQGRGVGHVRRSLVPGLPTDWRKPVAPGVGLLRAGLGLFGLRRPAMVGREQERDALWRALRACESTSRPGAALIRGVAGTGKSRLARWLGETAAELGDVLLLRVQHNEGQGLGLAAAMAAALRVVGLSVPDMAAWLGDALELPEMLRWSLVDLLHPSRRPPADPDAVWVEVLSNISGARAVVLWIDDLHSCLCESASLVRRILAEGDGATFVVCTVREDELDQRARAVVDRLGAKSFFLAPLQGRERRALVHDLLMLDDAVSELVDRRTEGVPLFAVQLVADWVQRGLLVPGPAGFRLQPGAEAELPDSLHGLWLARFERLAPADAAALELAAWLGREVDGEVWDAVCADAGIGVSAGLLRGLLAGRLVSSSDGRSWSFVHGMVAESLRRRSRDEGRAPGQRQAVSERLRFLGEAAMADQHMVPAMALLRRAHELCDTDAERFAVVRLLAPCERQTGAYDAARVSFGQAVALARVHGTPGQSVRLLIDSAGVPYCIGRVSEAREVLLLALSQARQGGDDLAVGVGHSRLSNLDVLHRDYSTAIDRLWVAVAMTQRAGHAELEAETWARLGRCCAELGDAAAAEAHLRRALSVYELHDIPVGRASVLVMLGQLLRADGRFREAWVAFEGVESMRMAPETRANLHRHLGNGHFDLGELDSADACYRTAIEAVLEQGLHAATLHNRRCLGLLQVERGELEGGIELVTQGRVADGAMREFGLWVAVRAHRLLGEVDVARKLLHGLVEDSDGASAILEFRARLAAEAALLELDGGRVQRARAQLAVAAGKLVGPIYRVVRAELAELWVRCSLAGA
jgi:eukaryotic-like serine/threonine-protein kinase